MSDSGISRSWHAVDNPYLRETVTDEARDGGWGCTFHRHFGSNAIHRDGYPESDQQGTHRVVYVFDPDYLEEHDQAVRESIEAEVRREIAGKIEAVDAKWAGLMEPIRARGEEYARRSDRARAEVAALRALIARLSAGWESLAARQHDWNDDRRDRADAMGHAAEELREGLRALGSVVEPQTTEGE